MSTASSNLGRNAWLVLGGGVTIAFICGIGLYFSNHLRDNPDAPIAFLGLGGSALSVCTVWALMLSIQALKRGERSTLPIVLMLAVSLPIGLFGLECWTEHSSYPADLRYTLLLPVVLPLFTFVLWTWTIIAGIYLRRVQAKRKAANLPGLTRGEKFRFAFKRGVVFALVCTLVLVPIPLFVMCGTWQTVFSGIVVNQTPEFFRDFSESLVHGAGLRNIDYVLLRGGNISIERLKVRLLEPEIQYAAYAELWSRSSEILTGVAVESELSQLRGKFVDPRLSDILAHRIVEQGNEDEFKILLKEAIFRRKPMSRRIRDAALERDETFGEEVRKLVEEYRKIFP